MVIIEHVHLPQYRVQKLEQIPIDEKNSHNQDDGNLCLHLDDNQHVTW